MHYPKVVSAAKGDRSHTIAGVSLRAQNPENIHPLARSAGEGAGGEGWQAALVAVGGRGNDLLWAKAQAAKIL